ncbi:hypothetical protein SAMN06295967_10482 [Belliella buryatensis]|uniref:Uncharacterized protein n=1 Tax=Belliella buryatensis TaxID=1500549 RepID=A0A239C6R4_9BACT|nr:hypothetical protein [Belliella buryatensis]SNS15114.1 hypothetical protein SAMN06295967_10482 [Belliella buryatensis]
MAKKKELKKKWIYYAVFGILLMGFGLSLLGDSIILKAANDNWLPWFLMGTFALICFFAGLSIFGQASVYKSKLSLKGKKKSKRSKK